MAHGTRLAVLVAWLCLVAGLHRVVAQDVDLELGLGLDDSGSIDPTEWALQLQAYKNVLVDPNVIPQDGTVAVGIWAFAALSKEIIPVTIIHNASDAQQLADAMDTYNRSTGSTAAGVAIVDISDAIVSNSINSIKQVIDISTDGVTNSGIDPSTAADQAVAKGIDQINCLAIEQPAATLCDFIRGVKGFAQQAATFQDFEAALRAKLLQEIDRCKNGGVLTAAGCQCVGKWGGPTCQTCNIQCQNGGTQRSDSCACDCVQPWGGEACTVPCRNVWSRAPFEPEEWQRVTFQPSLAPAADTVNLGTVFGSDTAELLLADDGQSLYVSGGELSVSHPNINVLRRYPDGSLKAVQQLTSSQMGAGSASISVGKMAHHCDTYSDTLYAIVFDHTPSTPDAYLTVFSRANNFTEGATGGFGRLSYLERFDLTGFATTETNAVGGDTDIFVEVSPDGDTVVVAGQKSSGDYKPIVRVFNRVWSTTSTTTTPCRPTVEKVADTVTVDVIHTVNQCASGYSCVNAVCTQRATDGRLQLSTTITANLDGFGVTGLLMSADSRFIYVSSLGYSSFASSVTNGLTRGNTITVLERSQSDHSISHVQTLVKQPAQGVFRSFRIFFSPKQRFLYTITDLADAAQGNRTIATHTRSHLDGSVGQVPLQIKDLGRCQYNNAWHPGAVCATAKYTFVQSRLAGRQPPGTSLSQLPAIYRSVDTSTEVFGWGRDVCPTSTEELPGYLRFRYDDTTNQGQHPVHSIACSDDFAYVKTNVSIVLLHTAPRDLKFFTTGPVEDYFFRKNVRIVPTRPRNKGGTIVGYTIEPTLPRGLQMDSTTGVISGTPVDYIQTTNFTIRGHNRMGQSTTSRIRMTIIEGTGYRCPSDAPQNVNATIAGVKEGFDFSFFDPWWWLFLLLLLLLLLLCCLALTMRSRRKGKENLWVPMGTSTERTFTHWPAIDETEEKEEEAPPLPAVPSAPKKKSGAQLRLRPTADRDIFMFGTRRIQLSIINNRLSVRVGGGWMPGSEFVQKNAAKEARKMGLSEDEMDQLTLDRVGDDLAAAEQKLREAKSGGRGTVSGRSRGTLSRKGTKSKRGRKKKGK